jgi:hypothetical protein
VRAFLRIEGSAAFAGSIALYGHAGFSWPLFALFFLAPDLAMLGYLVGPKTGAAIYNLVHTYAAPLILALLGFLRSSQPALAAALIWAAHIGLDRALGYGLKYPTAFGDTHLGRLRSPALRLQQRPGDGR